MDLGGVTAFKMQDKLCQQRQPLLNRTSNGSYQNEEGIFGPLAPKPISMELTAESHSIPLSDGNSMPLIGLGTYGDPRKVSRIVFKRETLLFYGNV